MKRSLFLLAFLATIFCVTSKAQNPPAAAIASGTALPATCQANNRNVFVLISGSSGTPYYCSAPNTWSLWSGGGGGGSPAGPPGAVQFDNSGSFGGDAAFYFDPTTHAVSITPTGTGTNFSALTIGDITGATNNWAIKTGVGQVYFGGASSILQFNPQNTTGMTGLLLGDRTLEPDLSCCDGAGNSLSLIANASVLDVPAINQVIIAASNGFSSANAYPNQAVYYSDGTVEAPTTINVDDPTWGRDFLGYMNGQYNYLATELTAIRDSSASGEIAWQVYTGGTTAVLYAGLRADKNAVVVGPEFGTPYFGLTPVSAGVMELNTGNAVANGGSYAQLNLGLANAQHYSSQSGTPTVAAGGAIGTTPTVVAGSTDFLGTVSVPSTAITIGTIATVTFATAYTAGPKCNVVQNGGLVSIGVGHGTPGTTTFTITSSIANASAAAYSFDYACSGA